MLLDLTGEASNEGHREEKREEKKGKMSVKGAHYLILCKRLNDGGASLFQSSCSG